MMLRLHPLLERAHARLDLGELFRKKLQRVCNVWWLTLQGAPRVSNYLLRRCKLN